MLNERIIFILSSYTDRNTGVGGHYRSVKTIAENLAEKYDVEIYSFGSLPSGVLKEYRNYTHFNSNKFSVMKTGDFLLGINLNELVSIICLDINSLIAVSNANLYCPGKVLFLKAGGPTFKPSFLLNKLNMVVFNDADKKNLENSDSKRNVFFAPCRIDLVKKNTEYAYKIKSFILDEALNIVFISRITPDKRLSIETVYKAIRNLEEKNYYINFIHIGILIDKQQQRDLLTILPNAKILHDNFYINMASQSLFSADAVCGLGRSILEGVSFKKPSFVPVNINGKNELILITPDNWTIFRESNFTHRADKDKLNKKGYITINDYTKKDIFYIKNAEDVYQLWCRDYSSENIINVWGGIISYKKQASHLRLPIRLRLYILLKEFVRNNVSKILYHKIREVLSK